MPEAEHVSAAVVERTLSLINSLLDSFENSSKIKKPPSRLISRTSNVCWALLWSLIWIGAVGGIAFVWIEDYDRCDAPTAMSSSRGIGKQSMMSVRL